MKNHTIIQFLIKQNYIQCEPNLEIYEVFRSDRNINRAVPVLFAKRNIKIGEELTFNYKMVKEEKIDSESECDENPEESEIQARARLFKCLCGAKSCKDTVLEK